MIFMYLTAHRKGPKDLTSPFDRSHAGILSWKMTNFTPIFWLPMEIRHTRWILNPYKVYIFWKLHVLGTYWVKSQRCSTNIEGVGFFTEHEKWNVTKILKCVIEVIRNGAQRRIASNKIRIDLGLLNRYLDFFPDQKIYPQNSDILG